MDNSTRYPLQLVDVRLYAAHLTRPAGDGLTQPAEKELPLTIEVAVNKIPPDHVSVLLTLAFRGDEDPYDITLVLEGMFDSDGSLDELSDDFWKEFHSVSALTLIWPYARECVSTIAWRMRLNLPILPTLNRLAMTPVQEEAEATTSDRTSVEETD